jgi:ubiquitin C-terminal hydrolase
MHINDISDMIFDHIDNKNTSSLDKIKLSLHKYGEKQRDMLVAENNRQTEYNNTYESKRQMQDDMYKQFVYDREQLYNKWNADKSKSSLYDMLKLTFEFQDISDIYTNTIFDKQLKKPSKEPSKEPLKEELKKPSKEPLKASKEELKKPLKEPLKASKEELKEPSKELLKEPLKEPVKETHCGIYNLGNSCYINSVLQFLVHIPEFNTIIIENKEVNDIVRAYADVYDAYTTNQYVPKQAIRNLVNNLNDSLTAEDKFDVESQMDASDFMNKLIEKMNITGLDEIFQLNLRTVFEFPNTVMKGKKELRCDEQKDIQNVKESSIILQFKDKKQIYNINDQLQKRYDGEVEEITKKSEFIDCDNAIEIESNKKLPKSHKFPHNRIVTVTSFPTIIKIIMAIFDNKLKKSFLQTEIPNQWQYGDNKYELKGIVVHNGATLDEGHYMYFSKEDKLWYEYSDNNVKAYNAQKPKKSYYKLTTSLEDNNIFYTNKNVPCPYILYYHKV